MKKDCVKMKAFNYKIDNNFLFVFFDDDKKLLYFVFQLSIQEIL